ncbi:MAG TPA: hypothetical protein VKF38_04225 [Anaerolineaceae bacterium]|nr:hypothetical protein [Anaerolineaceae bacterium]
MNDPDKGPKSTTDPTASQSGLLSNGNGVLKRRLTIFGLITTLFGFLVFLIGARPSIFGLDRSPLVGFIQISVFLVGLGIICVGGLISLLSLWGKEAKSIAADIGVRMIATGYLISVFSGLADILGFGSHHLPHIYYGYLQEEGVLAGEIAIGIGFLMLIPYAHIPNHPSLPADIQGEKRSEK